MLHFLTISMHIASQAARGMELTEGREHSVGQEEGKQIFSDLGEEGLLELRI